MAEWEKIGKTRIKTEPIEEGEKITWKGERQIFSRILVGVIALAWLTAWFNMKGQYRFLKITNYEPAVGYLLLFAWMATGVILLLFAFAVFRGPREGMLILGREYLIYKPGSPKVASWHLLSFHYPNWNYYNFLTGGKTLKFNKQDIKQIDLGCISGRLQLTFKADKAVIEIGSYLDEIEKKWLFKKISVWMGVK